MVFRGYGCRGGGIVFVLFVYCRRRGGYVRFVGVFLMVRCVLVFRIVV